ncbi:MAG: hypothetical protein EFT35_06635 [Methanophagales archaeon ANME-1-THS]|nr:MAG: hypothetical protein EFT35_06635 [Methanophagales archaeon ANME-1-THS]
MAIEKRKILIALTPSESKRLIAKGVTRLKAVQRALKQGTIIITLGTTNGYISEEILKLLPGSQRKIDKQRYAAGVLTDRGTCVVPKEEREKEVILKNGTLSDEGIDQAIEKLAAGDVFIKGANALDATGTAGIYMAHRSGGTIGSALGTVMARGVHFIIPVGIEKTIPYSITEAAKRVGIEAFYQSVGMPVGLMPVHGTIITEVEALKILGADDAFPIGAGGVDGGEGSVVLCVEGRTEKLDELMKLITGLKGEAPVKVVSTSCD